MGIPTRISTDIQPKGASDLEDFMDILDQDKVFEFSIKRKARLKKVVAHRLENEDAWKMTAIDASRKRGRILGYIQDTPSTQGRKKKASSKKASYTPSTQGLGPDLNLVAPDPTAVSRPGTVPNMHQESEEPERKCRCNTWARS